jgi:asparagine synthase (glutamine-hydrolysing)
MDELGEYMVNVLLRDTDAMSMAHSLEVRVPFLDHELVEAVAAMPGSWKLARDEAKPLLTDAVRGLLPDEVVQRPKMGFTLPFEHWLRAELRDQVGSALRDGSFGGRVATLLDGSEVARQWERFEQGRTSWSRPWALYALKCWGERHLG